VDLSGAVPIASAAEFDAWLRANAETRREVVIAIHKRSSPNASVGLADLQEAALCHGWVDVRTQRIDDQRYAVRFTPRRRGSNWTEGNRALARRLRDEGRLTPAALATLPADL
jgi:uncharacterized protein YdeI (YjbR/CyaY-like superfamily)